jgi:hypothetical protein
MTTDRRQSGPFGIEKNIPSGNLNTYYPVIQPSAKLSYRISYSESFCTAGEMVTFNLEKTIKAQRGLYVDLYSFFNLGAKCGWVANASDRPL